MRTAVLPSLPAPLPPGWRVRRPVPDDAERLYALVCSVDRAVLGWSDWARVDVEAFLVSSSAPAARTQLLVQDGERAVAWGWADDRAPGRVSVELAIDRTLPTGLADPLADRALRWLLDRARDLAEDRGRPDTLVDAGLVAGDEDLGRWLRAQGFSPARTYWRMSRAVADDPAGPAAVPGVVVRPVRPADLAAVHDVVQEAFAEHWNHHPRDLAEWLRAHRESAGHDLGLWWLAEPADPPHEPVGALVATSQMAEEDALYVATLGVRRSARGRGVARALLRTAFAEARRRGLARVALDVDGESTTGATALYRGEGMDVDFATQVLQRPVAGP